MATLAAPSTLTTAADTSDQIRSAIDNVDGSRITSTITDLQDFGSRVFFSDSMWNASKYIHDRFAELGLWVSYQDFVLKGHLQRNVIAIKNGSDPLAPMYLFGAHYDSITMDMYLNGTGDYAPGADDDASGVAATIELATILQDMDFNSTVKFVAFAAEETGLNGSFVFVNSELANGALYADTAILDMIGYRIADKNKAFVFRGTSENTLSASMHDAVYRYGVDLSLTFISGTDYAYSDHFPFWLAGYPSLMIIEELVDQLPANPYYHSENDTVAHLSEEQMVAITKALLGGFLELQSPKTEHGNYTAILIAAGVVIVASAVVITIYLVWKRRAVE